MNVSCPRLDGKGVGPMGIDDRHASYLLSGLLVDSVSIPGFRRASQLMIGQRQAAPVF